MSNYNEEVEQRNILADKAKQAAQKQGKKALKKVAKKALKSAAKVAAKALMALIKPIVTFLLGLLSPYILGILAIIFAVIIVWLGATLLFSMGDAELIGEDAYELRQYIEKETYNSVDQSRPEQKEYALPPDLIVTIMQIYDAQKNHVSVKEAIHDLVQKVKPTFTYDTVEGYTETYTRTCDRDGCSSTPVQKTPYEIEYLSNVEAWNGTTTAEMDGELGEWESRTSYSTGSYKDEEGVEHTYPITTTYYARSYNYERVEQQNENYSYFESILFAEPFEYSTTDIQMIEALYVATGGVMNYSELLSSGSMVNGGYGDYTGNINVIPGAGVPAEYMEYYLAAQEKYKVDWYFLAAFHYIETKFSTHKPMISSAGAEGHTQLCATFLYKCRETYMK